MRSGAGLIDKVQVGARDGVSTNAEAPHPGFRPASTNPTGAGSPLCVRRNATETFL